MQNIHGEKIKTSGEQGAHEWRLKNDLNMNKGNDTKEAKLNARHRREMTTPQKTKTKNWKRESFETGIHRDYNNT